MSRAWSEIEAKARFDQIRYAQVWEDADILVDALRVAPGETVVSVASAGDNALALLGEDPARVIAVDLSPAQLACLRLRMAAYRTLSHADLLELIGSRRSDRRSELLDRAARTLSEPDQAFWAPRRAAVIRHGLGGAGRFERYFRQFRLGLLPLVHDRRTVQALLEPRSPEQRARFWTQRWNSRRWRFLVDTFFSKTVMGRLGRDPSFFDHAEGSAARQVQAKTHQALVEQDPSQNPYLFWILNGRHGEVLPRALRPERFDLIRERLDRLELHEVPIEALAEAGVRAHAFNLSDIFEYMGPDAHGHAYATVLDAAAPGARIAYWNMMAPRSAPAPHQGRVRRDAGLEAQLKPLDKAFFYRDFVIEAVT